MHIAKASLLMLHCELKDYESLCRVAKINWAVRSSKLKRYGIRDKRERMRDMAITLIVLGHFQNNLSRVGRNHLHRKKSTMLMYCKFLFL